MQIVVCIKQVPGSTEVKIDPETHTLIRDSADAVINPFDTHALEAGVALKEAHGGTVTALTMGPPQATDALKDAIAVGADTAVLVSDRAFAGADTLATSYTLAAAVKKTGEFDLVICGKQTIDGDTGQVGPELSRHLGIPCVTYVRKIIETDGKTMKAERLVEGGYEVIEFDLPAVISVVKELNEPRVASLRGLMSAKKAEIPVLTLADLGLEEAKTGMNGSPTWVEATYTPERTKVSEVLTGTPEEQVERLVAMLKETGVL